MSDWNFNISEAPRGKTVLVEQFRKTADGVKLANVETFIPDFIWAASNCGKVIKSYWVPANNHHNGYFAGFPSEPKYGSDPIAWQPFVIPSHPTPTEPVERKAIEAAES
jgi:hypothetical protein